MSSSFIIEPQESGLEKKDDTLIIIVNDDGTISVDQETLQSLIMNQSNANVSVVRIGQAETDTENGDITLTVDPPMFTSTAINSGTSTDTNSLVDPFMEMDPEQLERLETALQSEEAKQILGENVTAMLDMLTVEEQQNSIRYSVKLDHCYTSRLSPSDPKPRDPLPVIDSPTSDDGLQYGRQHSPAPGTSKMSSPIGDTENTVTIKSKAIVKTGKPVGRPRKNFPATSTSLSNNSKSINVTSTPKSVGHPISRNLTGVMQQGIGKNQGKSNDEDDEELMSSTESSDSEPPSDNDSDFGPRGPRRGGVRARGGRKGLTTRGGSMIATRRRGPNKQMDMEQVRRLDMEMAAAVNAMKSPEKDEKSGIRRGFGLIRGKRQLKSTIARKKEESQHVESSSIMNEDISVNFDKPLQTTNQVKANLINANMIKGDMILTKPGQGRTNQKVTFVQKQVLMKPNDLKNIDIKKQMILPKGKYLNQTGTKFFATKDGKLVQIPVTAKNITSNVSVTQMKGTIPQISSAQQSTMIQNQTSNMQHQQSAKITSPGTISKIKSCDLKKEKRKLDGSEIVMKTEIDSGKASENKIFDGTKKHPKKENRKSPAYMVDNLGPALFSTPDIIRRVGSNNDSKIQENAVTSLISTTSSTVVVSSGSGNSLTHVTHLSSTPSPSTSSIASNRAEKRENGDCLVQNHEVESKSSIKSNVSEELQPNLDSSGIEGEEHLLATLEMEASKHEEELLAEALLLQEELGVDLAEHTTLVEQGGSVVPESLTSNSMLIPSLITSEAQEGAKSLDASTAIIVTSTISSTTVAGITTSANTNTSKEIGKKSKDDKEPIQIIRGGRVITLPPIEAPATRSRRLQVKTEPIQKSLEPVKRTEKLGYNMQQRISQSVKHEIRTNVDQDEKNRNVIRDEEDDVEEEAEEEEDEEEEDLEEKDPKQIGEEDEEEEEEEEEDNSDSEDDPDRLWCICKRPHNNRFMICCDVCEDWFHGKCVHVSKAMGQQMEEKGIEWVCPNCAKKKEEEIKTKLNTQNASGKQRIQSDSVFDNPKSFTSVNQTSFSEEISPLIHSNCDYGGVQYSSGMQCVVCKKEARNSSIYCSDACILAHAQETLTKDKPIPGSTTSPKGTRLSPFDSASKPKSDTRVIVFERKSGTVLTGSDAPTRSNLRLWLKEHPTFEVVGTNNLGTLQIGKTITTIQNTQISAKTGKSTLLSPGKGQNLPKLTYTKVQGSKQMILTTGGKKITVISSGQQQPQVQQQIQPTSTKSIQIKQTLLPASNKSSLLLKTTTTKLITQPQSKQANAVSPKQTPNVKKQESKQAILQSKQQIKPSPPKKPETEPIRLNIRKTLTELLSSRIKETEDLKLTDEEIADLAYNIELELYKYFKDTGAKYKAKYRSLVFNIKDTKNLTLFRKIADRSLTPDAVVRLSPDEMASQELAEWREKETKHQLEMIKKNELDLMAQAKSIVVKTHKGEQIIENDGSIDHVDPKTPVQDIVTALNNADSITSTVDDTEKDLERSNDEEKLKVKEDMKKLRSFDDKRKKDKEKDKGREKEKERDKEKEKGREKESNRSKAMNDRRGRSISRSRHKHSRDDRERKIREKSRERKSRDKESKREREKDRDKEKERDRDRDRERSRTRDREKSKLRSERNNREKTKQKEKDREREKEKERHKSNENSSRNRNSNFIHCDLKDVDKKDDERKRDIEKKEESGLSGLTGTSSEKSIEDRLWRHIEDEATTNTIDGNDSDLSDREPSSTVTIKTPDINDEIDREREQESTIIENETPKGGWQTVWRGFVNMVDVAKFFITAQEVSGHAKDLMDDLPDTVDVVGRISHETVWDYISKMKKTGSKEILVIRLTAANDEEKIPYITLYSYLNSRSRLGVVGNVSKNIKDFYIMPFSSQSTIPQVLLPLNGPGFEEHRPHLLLGIIVRNKRKRLAGITSSVPIKLSKKDTDRSYTPPLVSASKDKPNSTNTTIIAASVASTVTPTIPASSSPSATGTSIYHKTIGSVNTTESAKEKQHSVTQTTLDNLNRAHIGMSRSTLLDTATICKIVPELSSKIDLTSSPGKVPLEDDGDEPYSPGQMDEEVDLDIRTSSTSASTATVPSISGSMGIDSTPLDNNIISSSKNSTELQRKMEELNRQIEEQKQQIQNISSSFLGESTSTLPGLGLDPPASDECEEAYSPSDTRSFTPPPPPGISKFTQPILDKVSNITIPPNLQEILANVKRQESSKIDPYLPSKPSATFLTTANSSIYQNSEKYSSPPSMKLSVGGSNKSNADKSSLEPISSSHRESISKEKESKSTLSSLSDLDLIRKAEEELAAVAAVSAVVTSGKMMTENSVSSTLSTTPTVPTIISSPSLMSSVNLSSSTTDSPTHEGTSYKNPFPETFKRNIAPEQPKPPGLEDEDFPPFPSTPPSVENNVSKTISSRSKFVPKSGIVLSVKRKVNDDSIASCTPNKTQRVKSRWGQGPSESVD
ncbi:uncharacterized protein LOC102676589 isoform X3 [Apis dorsata]|uniref:uncharacterized protein LOC102676589 isoform X3 n=1 Tax=Apis dorsata TaxID=7462 RepID=UPI0003DF5BD4|nr:uncharacterized protein LOC102676589 isoform X3 [Apis dorsata]